MEWHNIIKSDSDIHLDLLLQLIMYRIGKYAVAAFALLMFLGQATTLAATLSVTPNTPPDISIDGSCSLIEAIVNSNNDAATYLDCISGSGADTILLPAGSTQNLTEVNNTTHGATGLPVITSTLTIEGNLSTIGREITAPVFRIISVGSGANLTLKQITIRGGLTQYPPADRHNFGRGAGVINFGGTLTVTDSSFLDNTARNWGGGIHSTYGTLAMSNCQLSGNQANAGGGVGSYRSNVTLIDNVFSGNTVEFDGGGLWGGASIMTLINNSFDGNSASYGGAMRHEYDSHVMVIKNSFSSNYANVSGGAIENGDRSTLVIANSTLSGNHADRAGGGVHNDRGTLTLHSSTVTGNTAGRNGGGVSEWGGGTVRLIRSTIFGNHADENGGGVNIRTGNLFLSHTLVAGNTSPNGGEINDMTGFTVANGYNLFGYSGDPGVVGVSPGPLDIQPSAPLNAILDTTLADNGGPTLTHALTDGSLAIDAGVPNFNGFDKHDQRGPGFDRVINGRIDVGAFESSGAQTSLSIDDITVSEGDASADFTVTLSPASAQTVTVDIASANGSAIAPDDYAAQPLTTLSFTPGQTSQTVSVSIVDDSLTEGTESFSMLLSNAVNATISDNTGVATILDNEASSCGAPSYDPAVDSAIFLWQDCGTGQWFLRATAGAAGYVQYIGNLASDQAFTSVTPFNLENGDVLDTSNPNLINFNLQMWSPWEDGFDFSYPAGSNVCLDIPGAPVLVGASRVSVTPPFNLQNLGVCN